VREYSVESIESKYRADLEELNQYAVIVPIAKEDIGAYVKGFEDMDVKKANEICREVINLLEFEVIMVNSSSVSTGFTTLVKEAVRKVCRMNKLQFIDSDGVYMLGESNSGNA
jgi:hypothetical protein